jgi:hypoxanthine phosphoribosyltransferase
MTEPIPQGGEIMISRARIRSCVARLGTEISADYEGRAPILVTVLKGAVFFLTDLAKRLSVPCMMDFMAISRYRRKGGMEGMVRITRDIALDITGEPVILVEDIIDTGLTVSYLRKVLLTRNPESVEICTLLNRKSRRIANIDIKYSGFEMPDIYVVGYGLDHKGFYRNLPDIYRIEKKDSPPGTEA